MLEMLGIDSDNSLDKKATHFMLWRQLQCPVAILKKGTCKFERRFRFFVLTI